MAVDKTLLAKLLSMTNSQHDGEALAAIRKANQLLQFQATTWSDILEISEFEAPRLAAPEPRPAPAELPPGHQRAAQYCDAFRREAMVLRLLAFPFWIFVELLAALTPDMLLNTRGRTLSLVFALCMLLSVAAWIGVAGYLVFKLD